MMKTRKKAIGKREEAAVIKNVAAIVLGAVARSLRTLKKRRPW